MKTMQRIIIPAIASLFLAGVSAWAADSDYDGRTDAQEQIDGTNPQNANSVLPVRLGQWRFNDTNTWASAEGQLPIFSANTLSAFSWSGYSLRMNHTNQARLAYPESQTNGAPAFNLRSGTVRFWFKPDWSGANMGGSGPGNTAQLVEVGAWSEDFTYGQWSLALNPDGTQIIFSVQADEQETVCLVADVEWTTNLWRQVTLTYSPSSSELYLDGQPVAWGDGVPFYPSATVRQAEGLAIGSDVNGQSQAKGAFEELETFNYPLSESAVQSDYLAMFSAAGVRPGGGDVYTSTNQVVITFEGVTASMASLVNDTNFNTAAWQSFDTNLVVNLPSGEAVHSVWVGVQGVSGETAWRQVRVIVDASPPLLTLTNYLTTTHSQPVIQLKGFCPEPLASLTFDLANAAGGITNDDAFVTDHYMDTNLWLETTNWFQLFDVELAPGTNVLTLRAIDLAGNLTVTNIAYVLDYSSDTNPPVMGAHWPAHGMQLSGTNFTLRGFLDDPTALVSAMVVGDGQTNEVTGIVERDGLFWLENLPLNEGENVVIVGLADAAGNVAVTNISVFRNALQLVINPPTEAQLTNGFITVTGTIDTPGHAVWVNGVRATVTGNAWSAAFVPLPNSGTATLQAVAISESDNDGNGTPAPVALSTQNNVSTGNPASTVAVAVSTDPDRPARQWISSYVGLDMDGYRRTFQGTVLYWWARLPNFHLWFHNVGGFAYYFRKEVGMCDIEDTTIWYADGSGSYTHVELELPGFSERVETSHGVAPGTAHVLYNNPSRWNDTAYLLWNADGETHELGYFYFKDGRTRLHTGGKSLVKKNNLFSFRAAALEHFYDYTGRTETTYRGIPATLLSVPGLPPLNKPGADGKLYKVLPDGAEYDITVKAPSKCYTYGSWATKHKLVVKANDVTLSDDPAGPKPEFCVGQKVTFRYEFQPPVTYSSIFNLPWQIPQKFVNEEWQESITYQETGTTHYHGSVNYRINPSLLANQTTSLWFVNGTGGTVSVDVGVTFPNGQTAAVTAQGAFTVYRPTAHLLMTPTEANRFFTLTDLSTGRELRLGQNNSTQIGRMLFRVRFDSAVPWGGTARITQLCQLDFSHATKNFPDWRLDGNTEWYTDDKNFDPLDAPNDRTIDFEDGPLCQNTLWYALMPNVLKGQYTVYARFRPHTPDSIFVTLGTTYWSIHGCAMEINGQWVKTSEITPDPTAINGSDAFPEWLLNVPE